jgi:four helix bundle protein
MNPAILQILPSWSAAITIARLSPLSECTDLAACENVAKHFSELVCWQLARELRRLVFKLTSRSTFNADFTLRRQLNDAASSACSNISEGFGRRTHKDFSHFLDLSRSSANEIENRLGESVERDYLTSEDIAEALVLVKRVRSSTSRLMAYLDKTPTPGRKPTRAKNANIRL